LTPEYRAWQQMRQRCYNPKVASYPRYGGRGIRVCQRWRNSFDAFFADVGSRSSPEHSLHRPDNDGNYRPGNVKWATDQEQNRCTSRNRKVAGQLLCEVAEQLGTSTTTIARRIDIHGWSAQKASKTKPRVWQHRVLTYKGKTMSLQAWAQYLKVSSNTLRGRLASGWTTAQTLSIRPALGNRIK
jgi:hypothetical protein